MYRKKYYKYKAKYLQLKQQQHGGYYQDNFQTDMHTISGLNPNLVLRKGNKIKTHGKTWRLFEIEKNKFFDKDERLSWDTFKNYAKENWKISPDEWVKCPKLSNILKGKEGESEIVTPETFAEAFKLFIPINSNFLFHHNHTRSTLLGEDGYVGHTIHQIEWILNQEWWCKKRTDWDSRKDKLKSPYLDDKKWRGGEIAIRPSSKAGSFAISMFNKSDDSDESWKRMDDQLLQRRADHRYNYFGTGARTFQNLPDFLMWLSNHPSSGLTPINSSDIPRANTGKVLLINESDIPITFKIYTFKIPDSMGQDYTPEPGDDWPGYSGVGLVTLPPTSYSICFPESLAYDGIKQSSAVWLLWDPSAGFRNIHLDKEKTIVFRKDPKTLEYEIDAYDLVDINRINKNPARIMTEMDAPLY